MASRTAPPAQGYLSRAELEMELARLALAVGRPSADVEAASGIAGIEWFQAQSIRLLERTPPELRSLVEPRIEELADAAARRDLLADYGGPLPFDSDATEARRGR
ncbi:hypothetical protein [Lysobacter xanthus]